MVNVAGRLSIVIVSLLFATMIYFLAYATSESVKQEEQDRVDKSNEMIQNCFEVPATVYVDSEGFFYMCEMSEP